MLSAGFRKVIAVGASTGGVDALEQVLMRFPSTCPPIVVVIHLQPGLARLLATQLNEKLKLSVKEAAHGDILASGQVFIAPSGKHMKIINQAGRLVIELFSGAKVQHVIPSVDVLFESVAKEIGANSIGVILTGIGADGAAGLKQMLIKGAKTIGQDEDTSVVYGMPKIAFEQGAVQHQLPIEKIGSKIQSFL